MTLISNCLIPYSLISSRLFLDIFLLYSIIFFIYDRSSILSFGIILIKSFDIKFAAADSFITIPNPHINASFTTNGSASPLDINNRFE
jgi:hypothetical protein